VHTFGRRPEETTTAAQLVALAIISLGDNWHNIHHATLVGRHGAPRHGRPVAWLIEGSNSGDGTGSGAVSTDQALLRQPVGAAR